MDGASSWQASSEVFQYMENTCVFRHVVGHAAALTNKTVLPDQNSTILVFYHRSVRGGSTGIDRFAGSIEPGEVFIAGTMYDCASQSEYLGVEYLSVRECPINGSGRVAVA
jgi:hypothetical protein